MAKLQSSVAVTLSPDRAHAIVVVTLSRELFTTELECGDLGKAKLLDIPTSPNEKPGVTICHYNTTVLTPRGGKFPDSGVIKSWSVLQQH